MKLTHFLHIWTVDVTCMVGLHTHLSVEVRDEPDAVFNCFPPLFLRHSLSLNLEFANSPIEWTASPKDSPISAFPALELRAQAILSGFRNRC